MWTEITLEHPKKQGFPTKKARFRAFFLIIQFHEINVFSVYLCRIPFAAQDFKRVLPAQINSLKIIIESLLGIVYVKTLLRVFPSFFCFKRKACFKGGIYRVQIPGQPLPVVYAHLYHTIRAEGYFVNNVFHGSAAPEAATSITARNGKQ